MPLSFTDSSGHTFYISYNQIGSARAITDENGNIPKTLTYDSFGTIIADSNPSFKILFGFAGGLYDHDTKLTRFGYRDYDASTGKWTAKDPIGFDGGDSNLYGYVLGDPVDFVDPNGLLSVTTVVIPLIPIVTYTYDKLDDMINGRNKLEIIAMCQTITNSYNYMINNLENSTCMSSDDILLQQLYLNRQKQIAAVQCQQILGLL